MSADCVTTTCADLFILVTCEAGGILSPGSRTGEYWTTCYDICPTTGIIHIEITKVQEPLELQAQLVLLGQRELLELLERLQQEQQELRGQPEQQAN